MIDDRKEDPDRLLAALKSPMPKPSFRSVLIRSMADIPDWVDREEFDEDSFENGYACIAVDNGGRVCLHGDGGEPEDNMYLRDWAWVAPTLKAAYKGGLTDGRAQTMAHVVGLIAALEADHSDPDDGGDSYARAALALLRDRLKAGAK